MDIREVDGESRHAVIALWREAELTRPWNSPEDDFDRAIGGVASAVLGGFDDHELVATAMVGHDGHRGWVYCLAVAATSRGNGLGRSMMSAAEEWVRQHDIPKIQLMVRGGNVDASDFYQRVGYERSDVTVFARRLDGR